MKTLYLLTFLFSASLLSAQNQNIKDLNKIMDNWHLAAATADEDAFFGRMAKEGIYIGTDASERWLRDELKSWAKSAFERESAWTFKAVERNWQMLNDDLAIGDELLDTWMGPCRSTMVLKKVDGEWLIYHYQLSVTVPNDKIQDFIKLMNL